MKLKVGEYTRINGKIGKIKDIILNGNLYEDSGIYLENEKIIIGKEEIHKLKSSKNIVDFIQIGDYVNGIKVTETMIKMRDEQGVFGLPDHYKMFIDEIHIKSIVTKEMFDSIKYEVE